jgi:hypothetical protein
MEENLCYRGCGRKATHYSKRYKQWTCDFRAPKCPVVRDKIGAANKGKLTGTTQSAETKSKRSKSLKEAYANGTRNPDEYKSKIRESNLKHWANVSRTPWNKGLTANDDIRIKAYADKQRGRRKEEPLEILERDDPIYRDFKKYRNRVAVRTEKTYQKFKKEINPNDLPRGKAGVVGAYQVDHIISVREGFEKGIPVEKISSKENLQMLPWLDNVQKYDGKRL